MSAFQFSESKEEVSTIFVNGEVKLWYVTIRYTLAMIF